MNTTKEIRIPVHSMVDVITNSSTVIYTQVTESMIPFAKAVINRILVDAGTDMTADDLYEFKIELDEDTIETIVYFFIHKTDDKEVIKRVEEVDKIQNYSDRSVQRVALYKNIYEEKIRGTDLEKSLINKAFDYGVYNSSLILTEKATKVSHDFTALVMKTFSQESTYNG